MLDEIGTRYGIDYRLSLRELIVANTDIDPSTLPANVFLAASTGG